MAATLHNAKQGRKTREQRTRQDNMKRPVAKTTKLHKIRITPGPPPWHGR